VVYCYAVGGEGDALLGDSVRCVVNRKAVDKTRIELRHKSAYHSITEPCTKSFTEYAESVPAVPQSFVLPVSHT
jgi:hypothetical protein